MATLWAVLVIADIGGHTVYMNWSRTRLANGQMAVTAPLEFVIDTQVGQPRPVTAASS